MNTKLNGWAAMAAWDRTFKGGHLPMWAKKALRKNAIKRGKWSPCYSEARSTLPMGLFDHWGSVNRNGIRALITQPYGNHDAQAAELADELGWTFKSSNPGPWAEGTWLYEFLPKDLPIVPAVEVVRLKAEVERLKEEVHKAWNEGVETAVEDESGCDPDPEWMDAAYKVSRARKVVEGLP